MAWLEADAHTVEVERARDLVLRRLERCAAPREALAQLLARKEVDENVATEVLDRLEVAGVIDDAAYAATLARTRFAEKGLARRAVVAELRRKGLRESHVQAALTQISSEDESTAAVALARKKLAATRHLESQARRRRVLALLGRKGYSQETALEAVRQALRQET